MKITVTNPATGGVVNEYNAMNDKQVYDRLETADEAWQTWRNTDVGHRSDCMSKMAALLTDEKTHNAELMALEMGKPVRQGMDEIEKCIWLCRNLTETAARTLSLKMGENGTKGQLTAVLPFGTIVVVMSWNYPFWQVFRYAAPAIMAGNAVLLKHSSSVPGCSLAIENIMIRAGFPQGLFQVLRIPGQQVKFVVDDSRIKAVILSGSKTAGQAIIKQVGGVIKKDVFELGGSDPNIILDDAELDRTVETCVSGCLSNSGQSCVAVKRFIVSKGIREAFEQRLVKRMRNVRMGDPLHRNTNIGPIARKDLRDTVDQQVRSSIDRGARCLLGGKVDKGKGFFYPPTVLTDVGRGMRVYEEETFGPVAIVVPVSDEKEAVRVANDANFGNGATVFTRNISRGRQIAAEQLAAGQCFINAFTPPGTHMPLFGIGERKNGNDPLHDFGMKDFVHAKTVHVGLLDIAWSSAA